MITMMTKVLASLDERVSGRTTWMGHWIGWLSSVQSSTPIGRRLQLQLQLQFWMEAVMMPGSGMYESKRDVLDEDDVDLERKRNYQSADATRHYPLLHLRMALHQTAASPPELSILVASSLDQIGPYASC